MDLAADFGPFDGRVWLNCAHQGPLPRVAAAAAEEALAQKRAPHRMTERVFEETPRRLRAALGELLGVPASEVVLGNATSYGLNLLVQGVPWRRGDEVLLVDGDFPATVITWLPLERRGVRVRRVRPAGGLLTAAELEAAITPATRLFCTSWVFSFFGDAVDLEALGSVCREHGVAFVVNGSQAVGARPLDLGRVPVDALVGCGFKWLCGPYGTGYCWLRPELADSLVYRQAYWLAQTTQGGLGSGPSYQLRDDLGAARFDLFGTANFLAFAPWTASLRYLLDLGIQRVAKHDQGLVDRLLEGLDPERWRVLSPRGGPERSTLVLLSHRDPGRNPDAHGLLREAGVDVALRGGNLRVSPHVHNTAADVDRLLEVLAGFAA